MVPYGFSFGEGVTAPLVQGIYATGLFGEQVAQLIGDYVLDVVDKFISVAIALVCMKALNRAGVHTIHFEL